MKLRGVGSEDVGVDCAGFGGVTTGAGGAFSLALDEDKDDEEDDDDSVDVDEDTDVDEDASDDVDAVNLDAECTSEEDSAATASSGEPFLNRITSGRLAVRNLRRDSWKVRSFTLSSLIHMMRSPELTNAATLFGAP